MLIRATLDLEMLGRDLVMCETCVFMVSDVDTARNYVEL
jgi:hypothetical protein